MRKGCELALWLGVEEAAVDAVPQRVPPAPVVQHQQRGPAMTGAQSKNLYLSRACARCTIPRCHQPTHLQQQQP